jgi:hypothetical protein
MITHDRPDRHEDAVYSNPLAGRRGPGGRRELVAYSGGEVPTAESVSLGFDINGQFSDDPNRVVAKRVQSSERVRCYVLTGTTGTDAGRLLNPYGLYFDENDISRFHAQKGRARYEFRRVSEPAFEDYMRFLRTRIESHLRSAERSVLDA